MPPNTNSLNFLLKHEEIYVWAFFLFCFVFLNSSAIIRVCFMVMYFMCDLRQFFFFQRGPGKPQTGYPGLEDGRQQWEGPLPPPWRGIHRLHLEMEPCFLFPMPGRSEHTGGRV